MRFEAVGSHWTHRSETAAVCELAHQTCNSDELEKEKAREANMEEHVMQKEMQIDRKRNHLLEFLFTKQPYRSFPLRIE
jgi:hypothetical protein